MMLLQEHFDFWHYVEVMVGVSTIFLPMWWANRIESKRNHTQNLSRLNYLINETSERPHHRHTDGQPGDEGPLLAQNIVYPPRPFDNK
jgi:hypothetical protein